MVVLARQPVKLMLFPIRPVVQIAARIDIEFAEVANRPMEGPVRQAQLEVDPGTLDDLIPTAQAAGAVLGIVVAQALVHRIERRLVNLNEFAVLLLQYRIDAVLQVVVVVDLGLVVAALQAHGVIIRRIGR